ncbi:ATP-binding protein [Pseudoduganella sp. OTU4001]|uniref:ATP-binding protein n=1 Tax=Pseudoduganella sp. OTU4001 TaxID=3043854 RepID=UPI00313E9CA2
MAALILLLWQNWRLRRRLSDSEATLKKLQLQNEKLGRHRIDFLAAMSHDIRTPLAGVIGMLKFALRDSSIADRTVEYLRIGLKNSEALLAMLNDLLDFSRIDAGRLSISTQDLDLIDVIDEAITILRPQADAKALLLRCELAPGLPRHVQGDPNRIRQILLNLLGNAIKFTERGEVRLRASGETADGLARIGFSISDTGPGIPLEMLPRLFRKFEPADLSSTRRTEGPGLGLAICKELVDLMGGHIEADTRLGKGTTVRFTLPLALGGPPERDPLNVPAHLRHTHRLRVLCAEDVRTNQIIITTLLEGMGHEVVVAENGLEALRALHSEDFDIVLMDGRMPQMDGEQAARLIRRGGSLDLPVRDPLVPIIALTANGTDLDRARYRAAGMDGFLSKPVDERLLYDQLEKTITQLLARGRQLPRTAPTLAELDDMFGVEPASTAIHILPLSGMTPRHQQRIAQAFLEEAPRRLDEGRLALQHGDGEGATSAFHALKGSCGYLSAPELHTLCHQMEKASAAGDLQAAAALLPELETHILQACADLRRDDTIAA